MVSNNEGQRCLGHSFLCKCSSSPSRGLPAPTFLSRRRAAEHAGPWTIAMRAGWFGFEPAGAGRMCAGPHVSASGDAWCAVCQCTGEGARPYMRHDIIAICAIGCSWPAFWALQAKKCPLGGGLKLLSWRRIVETGALCLGRRYASNDHFRYRSSRVRITAEFGRRCRPMPVFTPQWVPRAGDTCFDWTRSAWRSLSG